MSTAVRAGPASDIPPHSCTGSKRPLTSRITWLRASRTACQWWCRLSVRIRRSRHEVGGGESGWVAPHPAKPDIFFAGSTNTLTRFDRRTRQLRDRQPWPRIVMGEPASAMPERWNWTYPVVFSPLAPHNLYVASQHVWRSSDEGEMWERISPDRRRADKGDARRSRGGPTYSDETGPESCTGRCSARAPSRLERNTIWAGSDDGPRRNEDAGKVSGSS